MVGKTSEEVFNVHFAAALRDTSSAWRKNPRHIAVEELGQVNHSLKKPDIVINDRLYPPLIIETSFVANDADKDAVARLGYKIKGSHCTIHTTVALHIPEKFRSISDFDIKKALLSETEIRYAVHREIKKGGGTLYH